jgi:hypothetical protein
MRIYVGGSLRDVGGEPELCRQFVSALGVAIVRQGHILLNGCRGSFDQEIAVAANESLVRNAGDPKDRIVSYSLKSDTPVHSVGTLRYSALLDWHMNHPELDVPEQIELAGATIFVAGSEGTYWCSRRAKRYAESSSLMPSERTNLHLWNA